MDIALITAAIVVAILAIVACIKYPKEGIARLKEIATAGWTLTKLIALGIKDAFIVTLTAIWHKKNTDNQ